MVVYSNGYQGAISVLLPQSGPVCVAMFRVFRRVLGGEFKIIRRDNLWLTPFATSLRCSDSPRQVAPYAGRDGGERVAGLCQRQDVHRAALLSQKPASRCDASGTVDSRPLERREPFALVHGCRL